MQKSILKLLILICVSVESLESVNAYTTIGYIVSGIDTIPELMIPKYKERENQLQDSLRINTDQLTLHFWDQGVVDGDEIRIKKIIFKKDEIVENHEVCRIKLTADEQACIIVLEKNRDTYLRMDAVDMGEEAAYNSAFFKISSGRKKSKDTYILEADEERSAIFKLTFDASLTTPFDEKKTKVLEAISILENAKEIVISQKGSVSVDFIVDGRKAYTTKTKHSFSTIPVKGLINIGSNTFLRFRTTKKKQSNADAKIDLAFINEEDKKDKVKYHAVPGVEYVLPVKIVSDKLGSKKAVTVNTTSLKMHIRDGNQADGDVISITQNGKTILTNHRLQSKSFILPVNIEPNTTTIFKFEPIGITEKNSTNTATVVITDLAGNRIEGLNLDSYRGRPAEVIIEHVPE